MNQLVTFCKKKVTWKKSNRSRNILASIGKGYQKTTSSTTTATKKKKKQTENHNYESSIYYFVFI